MGQKFEKTVLRVLTVIGTIGCIILMKKPPVKDWLLIFLFKGYLSSILDKLLVRTGYIKYPVNLFGKYFDISFIYDYLLFPISCVYYNQIQENLNLLE
nr:CBO0543 family protein [Bacillus sp. SA1-12]